MSTAARKGLGPAALVLGIAVAGVAPATPASARSAGDVTGATAAACKTASIAGRRTCLAAGQSCARRYERQYQRHGFSCSKRDSRGRYRLVALKQAF